MTVWPFPAGVRSNPNTLTASSKIAYVDYVACEHCHQLWPTDKHTGGVLGNITPPTGERPRQAVSGV